MAHFFGLPGSQNDIHILHKSPLFEDMKMGRCPQVNFTINDNNYCHGYYLAYGIYPKWSTLVQAHKHPLQGYEGRAMRHFNKMQIALRKDVERAFRILKKKFTIIFGSFRGLDAREVHKTMLTCIILHNMVIGETRRDKNWVNYEDEDLRSEIQPRHGIPARNYAGRTNHIQNATLYKRLRADLTVNLWAEYGRSGAMD